MKARKEEGETIGEALVRLAGGPHPEEVAGLLSDETAEEMHEVIEARGQSDPDNRKRIVEMVEDADDS